MANVFAAKPLLVSFSWWITVTLAHLTIFLTHHDEIHLAIVKSRISLTPFPTFRNLVVNKTPSSHCGWWTRFFHLFRWLRDIPCMDGATAHYWQNMRPPLSIKADAPSRISFLIAYWHVISAQHSGFQRFYCAFGRRGFVHTNFLDLLDQVHSSMKERFKKQFK